MYRDFTLRYLTQGGFFEQHISKDRRDKMQQRIRETAGEENSGGEGCKCGHSTSGDDKRRLTDPNLDDMHSGEDRETCMLCI